MTSRTTRMRVTAKRGWFWRDRSTAGEIVAQTADEIRRITLALAAGSEIMRMTRATVLGLGIVLTFATPVAAQTVLLRQPSPRPVLYAEVMPSASIAVPDSTAPGESALGAYDLLSVGNRKIARALHEAQQQDAQRLSLDEIAAMKRSGSGWGEVFKTMRARGLVTDSNLGQVVSRSTEVSGVKHDDTGDDGHVGKGSPGRSN